MPELLAPAPSPEAVIAAVQNGADAVYFSYGGLVPRSRSYNFTKDEFRYAAEYCRVRGAKIYADLTALIQDEGFTRFAAVVKSAAELGADAVIVDDLGALRVARQVAPTLPVHTGPRLAVHCAESAAALAQLGAARVCLSPYLTRQQAAYITRKAGVETEMPVQGPLCAAHPGSCLMSSWLTGAGENRGLCTMPCLENFVLNKKSAPYLSARDLSLAARIGDLQKCGATALRIDSATRRPEYTALYTGIFARALESGRAPDEAELQRTAAALGLKDSTDAPFMGEADSPVLGAAVRPLPDDNLVLSECRRSYLSGERKRVPLNFAALIRRGHPAKFAAEDDKGTIVSVDGPIPAPAGDNPLTYSRLKTLFHRTDGTPFLFGSIRVSLDEGEELELPGNVLTGMLRDLLQKMLDARRAYTPTPTEDYHAALKYINPSAAPLLNISVSRPEQMTKELAGLKPALLYVPLRLITEQPKLLLPFWENEYTELVAALPPVLRDLEGDALEKQLDFAKKLNIKRAAVHDLGHAALAAERGFIIHGDTGLNVYNSNTMRVLKDRGFASAALSYEISFKQVRELSKAVDAELVVYGRVPLMHTAVCVTRAATGRCACDSPIELLDKKGGAYPVLPAEGCGSTVYSPGKLFFGGRRRLYQDLGLWAVRLNFTTENALECVQVMERYLGRGRYEPTGKTRGIYARGIE